MAKTWSGRASPVNLNGRIGKYRIYQQDAGLTYVAPLPQGTQPSDAVSPVKDL